MKSTKLSRYIFPHHYVFTNRTSILLNDTAIHVVPTAIVFECVMIPTRVISTGTVDAAVQATPGLNHFATLIQTDIMWSKDFVISRMNVTPEVILHPMPLPMTKQTRSTKQGLQWNLL